MKLGRVYGHFAAAYGTCFLAAVLVALVTRQHIELGMFGMIGPPIIAVIYAWMRYGFETSILDEIRLLRVEVAKLAERPAQT